MSAPLLIRPCSCDVVPLFWYYLITHNSFYSCFLRSRLQNRVKCMRFIIANACEGTQRVKKRLEEPSGHNARLSLGKEKRLGRNILDVSAAHSKKVQLGCQEILSHSYLSKESCISKERASALFLPCSVIAWAQLMGRRGPRTRRRWIPMLPAGALVSYTFYSWRSERHILPTATPT